MSNKGARAYYQITEKLRDFLLNNDDINTVTIGDITQIDLNKQEMFPLGHIMINNANLNDSTIQFNITVMVMDIVWQTKKEQNQEYDQTFIGIDNEQDVLNTQLTVINLLNQQMIRGSLRTDGFELVGQSTCEPFKDRFENEVAGWAYSFSVYVRNDIDICVY